MSQNSLLLGDCPNCGGQAAVKHLEATDQYYCKCSNCGLTTLLRLTPEAAAEAWNSTVVFYKNNPRFRSALRGHKTSTQNHTVTRTHSRKR